MSDVYLDGKFIGTVENGKDFVEQVRAERRQDIINPNLNIYLNEQTDEITILTGKGRVRR